MADVEIVLGDGVLSRLNKARALTEEQIRAAQIIVTEQLGIGGRHDREADLTVAVAAVIAQNYSTLTAFIKK